MSGASQGASVRRPQLIDCAKGPGHGGGSDGEGTGEEWRWASNSLPPLPLLTL